MARNGKLKIEFSYNRESHLLATDRECLMLNTWILIANSSEAHIYALDHDHFIKGKIKLDLIDTHTHPDSRKKDDELVSDRMGSFRTGSTKAGVQGHGSFQSQTDPHEHEAEVFAIELSKTLENDHANHKYTKLVLVAPSHFVGLLHKHLHINVTQSIYDTIEKDYIKTPNKKLIQYMTEHLIKAEQ